jgi:hypothetical protein
VIDVKLVRQITGQVIDVRMLQCAITTPCDGHIELEKQAAQQGPAARGIGAEEIRGGLVTVFA